MIKNWLKQACKYLKAEYSGNYKGIESSPQTLIFYPYIFETQCRIL